MIAASINGVPLDDPNGRWFVLDESDVMSGIVAISVNTAIPGMDGSVPVDESLAESSKTLVMIVSGISDADLRRNVSALTSLIRSAETLSQSVDGVDLTIGARFREVQKPVWFPDGTAKVTATLRLPGIFWRGQSAPWTVAAPASGTTYPVTTLDGSTAPVDDALVLIDGPVTNPKLSCGSGWFRLGLTLAAGESALVDCRSWSVRAGAGVTFAGGGTVKTGVLSTSGGPYMLRLRPAMVGTDPTVTQVQVALTFDAGTPSLSIQAAPAFLA